MLQKQAIAAGTFTVLERLMALPELQNFALAGGTALALHYGHRISVDIDLFSTIPDIDKDTITKTLSKEFGEHFFYEKTEPSPGIFCYINDIKVDIIKLLFFSNKACGDLTKYSRI